LARGGGRRQLVLCGADCGGAMACIIHGVEKENSEVHEHRELLHGPLDLIMEEWTALILS